MGSQNRVKALRAFILNPEESIDVRELSKKIKVPQTSLRKEINLFKTIDLVKEVKVITPISTKKGTKRKVVGKKTSGYTLNPNFPYIQSLRMLLNADLLHRQKNLATYFKKCGDIKFLAVSGVFLQDDNSRIDMMIVGNNLKKSLVDTYVRDLEAEVGKELNYAVLDTTDFNYRVNSGDKFVRDLLDYPHERVIDKMSV